MKAQPKRCHVCGRYMTPYLSYAYGRCTTAYLCECGNHYEEESRTVASDKTEFTGYNTTNHTVPRGNLRR